MVPIEMRMKAERRLRELLSEDGYAQPNIVQYGSSFIHLFWHGTKVSILVEITNDGQIGQSRACDPVPETKAYVPVTLEGLSSRPADN
jgi:hypothetical protein